MPYLDKLPVPIAGMPIIEALILLFIVLLFGRKYIWGNPTLNIKPFVGNGNKQAIVAGFSSMVERTLIDLTATAQNRHSVYMVTGPITPISVDVGRLLPAGWGGAAELAQRMLGWLVAKPALAISGCIHDPDKVTRFTIQLESGNRILTKHSIGAGDFGIETDDSGTHLEQLAELAAIWAIFSLSAKNVVDVFKKHHRPASYSFRDT